jgi:hypothetical protein
MTLHITGRESGSLSDAIKSATKLDQLERILRFKLEDDIESYDEGSGADQTRFKLIERYNAQWRIDELVVAMLEHAPDNGKLLEFAWKHRIINRPAGSDGNYRVDDNSLERMLDPQQGFSNPIEFFQRFGQVIRCVCRIAVPSSTGIEYGTGFLIGNETLITNYHVMQRLIEKKPGTDRTTVSFLFDYFTDPSGNTVSSGVEYKLINDDGWIIDYSPYHSDDLVVRDVNANLATDRPIDCLDYAVVRLAGEPGKKQLGVNPIQGGATRGFIELPTNTDSRFATDFEVGKAAVFIFQHPSKEPLRLDWDKPAVLGVNGNGTRALYNVNTQHGSSGSPCLNAKLELIALHHAGGKDWPAEVGYLYNQGIPIGKIRERLVQNGKLAEIH